MLFRNRATINVTEIDSLKVEPMPRRKLLLLSIVLALLFAAVAGLFCRQVGRVGAAGHHRRRRPVSPVAPRAVPPVRGGRRLQREPLHLVPGQPFGAHAGFSLDRLTAMMMVVVTFVSLMVHIYTIAIRRGRRFPALLLHRALHLLNADANNFPQLLAGEAVASSRTC